MTTPLPPFSGDDPTCPKCGNVGATTSYLYFGQCEHPAEMISGFETNERLCRACTRCGFGWGEALAGARRSS